MRSRSFTSINVLLFSIFLCATSTGCFDSRDGLDRFFTRPAVSGKVTDADNRALSGVIVTTSDGNNSTVTDTTGSYRLHVPYDWSGAVVIHSPIAGEQPTLKTFDKVTSDTTFDVSLMKVRIAVTPRPGAGPFQRFCATSEDCDDGVFCNGIEICQAGHCATGSPPCADSQTCLEDQDQCGEANSASLIYVDDNGPAQPGYNAADPLGSVHHPYTSIQLAVNAFDPGSHIVIREGTYTSGSTAATMPIVNISDVQSGTEESPLVIRAHANEHVVLDGQNLTQNLMVIDSSYVDIEGLEFTRAQRTAVEIRSGADLTHHINVRGCFAYDNVGDSSFIGAAFRTVGPVQYVSFEDCISARNSGGFQLRESPTQTAATALVPPVAGNTGFDSDLSESEWAGWEGWTEFAARYCAIRRCLAFDNRLIAEHSDGFACRYAIESTFEDNIAFGNSDDGFDMLGATRCIIRRNIAFNANPEGRENGDGNGMKIGVRGGLYNVIEHNLSFNNPRAGIDLADTERARCYNNTTYGNGWFGIWSEASRAVDEGSEIVNNLCTENLHDIGAMHAGTVSRIEYNAVGDNNVHTAAIQLGSNSYINFDPGFLNPDLEINTEIPSELDIPRKIGFIREQVYQKLGLDTGSQAVDAGIAIPGVTVNVLGEAPDLGGLDQQ